MGSILPLLISTSRYPTRRTRTFCRDLVSVIPNSYYLTRGHSNIITLASYAKSNNYEYLGIVSTWKGNPGKITFYRINRRVVQIPPIVYLRGVATSRDLKRKRMRKRINKLGLVVKNRRTPPLLTNLAEIFNASIVYSIEESNYDIFAIVSELSDDILKIKFIYPLLVKDIDQFIEIGPIIKLKLMDVPSNVSLSSNT